MRLGIIIVAALTTACVPTDNAAQKAANKGPCARTVVQYSEATTEMPPENFGEPLVGLFTLITAETRFNPGTLGHGRFALLDCKAARLVRVHGTDKRDIRVSVADMRSRGATTSLQRFSQAARAKGLLVEEGSFPRESDTRAACACGSVHPKTWYEGFPPDGSGYNAPYVEPVGLPVE